MTRRRRFCRWHAAVGHQPCRTNLASHPRVFGAGESIIRDRNIRNCAARGERVPRHACQMSNEDFRELGRAYVERMSREGAAKDPPRIVPQAAVQLPGLRSHPSGAAGARISPCQTQCIDTCVSCYSLLLRKSSHSPTTRRIGRYYRASRNADGTMAVRAAAGTNARSGV